jgi:hypothetical protein
MLINPGKQECLRRLESDITRPDKAYWADAIEDWYEWYDYYKTEGVKT